MSNTIFFEKLDVEKKDFLWDYDYGLALKELINGDKSIKVITEENHDVAYYYFDDDWIYFFDFNEGGIISLRLSYVHEHLELYYKLLEIAKKLDLCLVGEEVLFFIPEYGILYDPEDPEESLSYEILVDEVFEKLNNGHTSIVEVINSIVEDKNAEILVSKPIQQPIDNFNTNQTPAMEEDDVNYTKLMVIFGIVLFIIYYFVI